MEMVSLQSNDYKEEFDKTHLGVRDGSGNVIEMTSRETKNPHKSNEADYQSFALKTAVCNFAHCSLPSHTLNFQRSTAKLTR